MYLSTLPNRWVNDTTSPVADFPMVQKLENPFPGKTIIPIGFCQEGVYFESLNRTGTQVDSSAEAFDASQVSENVSTYMHNEVALVAYVDAGDSNKAKIVSIKRNQKSNDLTISDPTVLNSATTNSINLKKITPTKAVFTARDDGGSDRMIARIISVDSDGTITAGDEKEITGFAIDDVGTSACMAITSDQRLVFSYVKNSDTTAYVRTADYTGTTIGNLTATTKVSDNALKYIDLCEAKNVIDNDGYIVLVCQDDDTSDHISGTVCQVLTDGTINIGTLEDLSDTDAAATSVKVFNLENNTILISWVDSTYSHLLVADVDTDNMELDEGSELEVTDEATLTPDVAIMDSNTFYVVYENDAQSDYIMATRVTRSDKSLTKGEQDVLHTSAASYISTCAYNNNHFLVNFEDDGNTSGKTLKVQEKDNLIDIRSTSASVSISGAIFTRDRNCIGFFSNMEISGTTNSSANTAMSTKVTLPYLKSKDIVVFFTSGKGMYIEDDGTDQPFKSGVDIANRTLDVRSTTTSQSFTGYIMRFAGHIMQAQHN